MRQRSVPLDSFLRRGLTNRVRDANAISQGTTASKTPSPVISSKAAPVPPPIAQMTNCCQARLRPAAIAWSPARTAAPAPTPIAPRVFVTLAVSGGSPTASSAG